MSRNSKLREVAAKLPPIPKRGKNGKYLFDRHGKVVQVDHFQVMCELKNALPQPKFPSIDKVKSPDERKQLYWEAQHKMEIQIIGKYTTTVLAAVRKRRVKRIAKVLKWGTSAVSLSAVGLYLWLRGR